MKYLWKSSGCQTTNCPALLETDEHYYIVGTDLTAEELTQVTEAAAAAGSGIGNGETVVRLPKDVIDRLAQRS